MSELHWTLGVRLLFPKTGFIHYESTYRDLASRYRPPDEADGGAGLCTYRLPKCCSFYVITLIMSTYNSGYKHHVYPFVERHLANLEG